MNRPVSIIALGVVVLAALGFGSRLLSDPTGVFTTILIFVAVAGILIFIFKKFSAPSDPSQKKYKRAVKQSKLKQQQKNTAQSNKTNVVNYSKAKSKSKRPFKTRKSNTHLTVIEGKKGKKKNRA
ncbi:MAG: SA1362 family protein [Bacillus sp. (in: firmicutes)]